MLLRHKRPATPPQLLHEWQTFRNFAIVKQKNKLPRQEKFFSWTGKNDECGRWNVEWSAEPMKNEE